MAFRTIVALACLALGSATPAREALAPPPRAPSADVDGSGTLDVFDYLRFQSLFAAGDRAADWDGTGALDVFDFLCFHNAFAAGLPEAVEPADWMGKAAPGQWCFTQEHYIAGQIGNGTNPTVVCAPDGPCDAPSERNAAIPDGSTPIRTYRLSIHVFCDDNGSNCSVTQADVDACIAVLNSRYAPWRIQFIYQTNFINSTKYRIMDGGSDEYFMKKTYADSPATKLNVYVVDTPGTGNWGTFPWDPDSLGKQGGIVMDYLYFGAGTRANVLVHEVGHCLGLWHTHHGVSEVTQCGDCYEAAGRSIADGDIAGDRCSDTNPTPTNPGYCADVPGTDPCSGLPWGSTPYTNYMDYASFNCVTEFTPQQAGRMHCWTADVLSGWLQLPEPPAAPGAPSLTKLGGGAVRATWADNSNNEDGFRVQRETKSGPNWVNTQIVATVGANTTAADNSPGAGTFRYRVQAFNGNGDSVWSGWTQIKN